MLSASQGKIPSPVFEHDKDPTAVMLRDDCQPGLAFFTLNQLRRRNQLCDVEIRLQGNIRLPAHKVVLVSSSPYFMKLLVSQQNSNESEISLEMSQIDVTALEMLIEFIYSSMLRITQSSVKSLCCAAKLLEMERIERACCKFMVKNLSKDNCIDFLRFADENVYSRMHKQCQDYMAKHIGEVTQASEFQLLTPEELAGILASHSLDSVSQSVIFDSLMHWVEHNPTARQKYLYKLFMRAGFTSASMSGSIVHLLKLLQSSSGDKEPILKKLKACFETLKRQPDLNRNSDSEANRIMNTKQDETDESSAVNDSIPPGQVAESKEGGEGPTTALLFAAGGNTKHSATASVERYDFRNGGWMPAINLPRKKSHAALVGVCQKLYSIGGFDGSKRLASVDIYDPQLERWSEGPAMHTPRSAFGAACDSKGNIYCIGGYSNSRHITTVEILDSKTKQWREGPPLQEGRSYVQAAAIGNNIYAVGGTNGSTRLRSVEKLSNEDRWVSIAELNIPRSRPGVATLNGCIYAVGGYDGLDHLNSIECYNPKIDKWTLIESMSIPRNSPAVCNVDGCLYIAGGHDGKKLVRSVEVYHPNTGKWTSTKCMQLARCDFGMATVVITAQQPIGTWI